MYVYKIREKNPSLKMKYIFENIIIKIDWTHNNQNFAKLANKFNKNTKKYVFNSSARVITGLCEYLLNESNEGEQCKWNL